MVEPLVLQGRPNPPSVPLADRCTINRAPAPGVRPSDPFPGRLRSDPTRAGIRDLYASNTFINELTVAASSLAQIDLGIVPQATTEAHLKVTGFALGGAVLDPTALETLLVPVQIYVLSNLAPVYRRFGCCVEGITFNVDFEGGERISILVDNTDARSVVAGETFIFQLFVNCVPKYAIETGRKDNPIP